MSRRGRRYAVKRSKDLVWVTSIIDASLLEVTPTDILDVVLSGDWSLGNAGFDRCTLMAVRGCIAYAQVAAATAAESTGMYMAMYVTSTDVAANSMDPSVATEYVTNDVIWTDAISMTTNTGTSAAQLGRQLDIRARRKLTTASRVSLAAVVGGADTGTPRMNFNGIVRALLRLDPPS